jgi:hypothetical protein
MLAFVKFLLNIGPFLFTRNISMALSLLPYMSLQYRLSGI